MITLAAVEKLRSIRAGEREVLSLYLPVPLDPAGARELPALARELIEAAQEQAGRGAGADLDAAVRLVEACGRDWLGHTAAIFACGRLGLLEVMVLPGDHGQGAVLGHAPYVRPLLAAAQRSPAYLIAVADQRRAWLLSVSGGQAQTIMRTEDPPAGPPGFGGWQGRDAYRVQRRMIERDRQHYHEIAGILARQVASEPGRPVVAGGHAESVGHLVRAMPPRVKSAFAGSFAADLHTLTPARAQELAAPVIVRWNARREHEAASSVFGAASDERRAVGLTACLAAAAAGAIGLLLLRDGARAPGFACVRCGALATGQPGCAHGSAAAEAVPDLLELLAGRILDDGGEVLAVRGLPANAAARLRYPWLKTSVPVVPEPAGGHDDPPTGLSGYRVAASPEGGPA